MEGGGGLLVDEEGVEVRDREKVLRDEKEALRGVVVSRGEGLRGEVMVRAVEDEGTGVTKLLMSETKETSPLLLLLQQRLDLERNTNY